MTISSLQNTISVVIPIYNSAPVLKELVQRLQSVLGDISSAYEIILVNDGSRDESWSVIKNICTEFQEVKGIDLMRNYGQHNALLCGIRAARYDVIITMDDDLQHPPEEIPALVEKLAEGFDVVYGFPRKLPHSIWRNIFSRLTKRTLAMVMGIKTVREISAFRAFRKDLRKAFDHYSSPGVIIDALLSWGTTNFTSIPVDEKPREQGTSNYNFLKLASQGLLVLTGFSTIPLRFASWFGFFIMLVGFFIFAYVVIIYFALGSIPGFPFLASIISIFSGAQLFSLGIFGEYLARIFDRSIERPTYKISRTVNQASTEGN
ncbi:MAG: glycosyltransferase family 2 protein [Anaerolineaceae bacterium]|nr:glycosyltransferase family 2 protein [Anaerolineaceae bacterium]